MNLSWFSNFVYVYDGGLCTFALFECLTCCLFCSWFLFLLHCSTAGQWKKKAKTQEGSLRNSVNFCTISVALSFCKMCCPTYASLVVFVLYHDIDRAVYAPVALSSFFSFFFSWNDCATLCLRIYSFSWLLFLQAQFLFLSERST